MPIWITKLASSLCGGLILLFSNLGLSAPISQVSQITLSGPTYEGDLWTLTLSTPVFESVSYTTSLTDVYGCNICNVTANWGAAINADPGVSSILTASYEIWDGVSQYDPAIILTANNPGVEFAVSVAVLEASDSDFNETEPLSVSVVTITEANVVEAPTACLLALGLLVLQIVRGWKGRRASPELLRHAGAIAVLAVGTVSSGTQARTLIRTETFDSDPG